MTDHPLSPCPAPRCKSGDVRLHRPRRAAKVWAVCHACFMRGPAGSSDEEAGELWNELSSISRPGRRFWPLAKAASR